MMVRTIVMGLFKDADKAGEAIDMLHESVLVDDVSFMAHERGKVKQLREEHSKADDAAKGATVGAGVGGLTGLLLGATALAIPGAGPIIAAGWLAGAIGGVVTGAVTGGVIGALKHTGLTESQARRIDDRLAEGDILVAAETNTEAEDSVAGIMERAGGKNVLSVEGARDVWDARERAAA